MIDLLKRFSTLLKLHNLPSRNWKDMEYFDDAWKKRIKVMAEMINKESKTILDLGCGRGWLKDFLHAEISYIGVDYKLRDNVNNLVCDFNMGQFPQIKADTVFCSGILEYIEDLQSFIKKIASITDQVVLSYCSTNYQSNMKVRKHRGWKNHLTNYEIISLFIKNGFVLASISNDIPGQIILDIQRQKKYLKNNPHG